MFVLAALLSLTINPQACMSPCDARFTVKVDSNALARCPRVDECLEVTISGEDPGQAFRQFFVVLTEGRRTYEWRLTLYGAGTYEVRAVLFQRQSKSLVETSRIEIGGNVVDR